MCTSIGFRFISHLRQQAVLSLGSQSIFPISSSARNHKQNFSNLLRCSRLWRNTIFLSQSGLASHRKVPPSYDHMARLEHPSDHQPTVRGKYLFSTLSAMAIGIGILNQSVLAEEGEPRKSSTDERKEILDLSKMNLSQAKQHIESKLDPNRVLRIKGAEEFLKRCQEEIDRFPSLKEDFSSLKEKLEELREKAEDNWKNFQERVSEKECALFASLAYKNSLEELGKNKEWVNLQKRGWETLSQKPCEGKRGYHGWAFVNHKLGQVIIAHRGTDLSDAREMIKDLYTDLNEVANERMGEHQKSALKFTTDVSKSSDIQGYKIGIVGHSLGGWLAKLSSHALKEEGIDSYVICLDPPGTAEMVKKFYSMKYNHQPKEEGDFMSYSLLPNIVNCFGTHEGSFYQLSSEHLTFENKRLDRYILDTHLSDNILKAFPENEASNVFQILDWPRMNSEEVFQKLARAPEAESWTGLLLGIFQGVKSAYSEVKFSHTLGEHMERLIKEQSFLEKLRKEVKNDSSLKRIKKFADDTCPSEEIRERIGRSNSLEEIKKLIQDQRPSDYLRREGHYKVERYSAQKLALFHFPKEVREFLHVFDQLRQNISPEVFQAFLQQETDKYQNAFGVATEESPKTLNFLMDYRIEGNMIVTKNSYLASELRKECQRLLLCYPEIKQNIKFDKLLMFEAKTFPYFPRYTANWEKSWSFPQLPKSHDLPKTDIEESFKNPSISTVVLFGNEGPEKSELAKKWSQDRQDHHVFYFDASNPSDFNERLIQFGTQVLGIDCKELVSKGKNLGIAQKIAETLKDKNEKAKKAQESYILVFDDVDDLENIKPLLEEKLNCKVLVTTKSQVNSQKGAHLDYIKLELKEESLSEKQYKGIQNVLETYEKSRDTLAALYTLCYLDLKSLPKELFDHFPIDLLEKEGLLKKEGDLASMPWQVRCSMKKALESMKVKLEAAGSSMKPSIILEFLNKKFSMKNMTQAQFKQNFHLAPLVEKALEKVESRGDFSDKNLVIKMKLLNKYANHKLQNEKFMKAESLFHKVVSQVKEAEKLFDKAKASNLTKEDIKDYSDKIIKAINVETRSPKWIKQYSRSLNHLGKICFQTKEDKNLAGMYFNLALEIVDLYEKHLLSEHEKSSSHKSEKVPKAPSLQQSCKEKILKDLRKAKMLFKRNGTGWLLIDGPHHSEEEILEDLHKAKTLYSKLYLEDNHFFNHFYCDLQLGKIYHKLAQHSSNYETQKYYYQKSLKRLKSGGQFKGISYRGALAHTELKKEGERFKYKKASALLAFGEVLSDTNNPFYNFEEAERSLQKALDLADIEKYDEKSDIRKGTLIRTYHRLSKLHLSIIHKSPFMKDIEQEGNTHHLNKAKGYALKALNVLKSISYGEDLEVQYIKLSKELEELDKILKIQEMDDVEIQNILETNPSQEKKHGSNTKL